MRKVYIVSRSIQYPTGQTTDELLYICKKATDAIRHANQLYNESIHNLYGFNDTGLLSDDFADNCIYVRQLGQWHLSGPKRFTVTIYVSEREVV